MREVLIRYLLGELTPEEHDEVQARLHSSPELRQELAQLRACFASHQNDDDLDDEGPPSDLAARTAQRVSDSDEFAAPAGSQPGTRFSTSGDPPSGILGWSLADLTVAGGVMLAVSMLLFPALRNSRDGTRREVCGNNQRQLWMLVSGYAQDHGGLYPCVAPNEPAGVYVARLIENRYALPSDLEVLLVCPGAPLAEKIRNGEVTFRLPSAETLRALSRNQRIQLASKMSPFYAYRFPYRVGRDYCNIRDEHQPLSPVFADAAGDDGGNGMSPNHGHRVIQVIFEDGSLKALTRPTLPGSNDDLFHNDLGRVAAGMSRQDSVLGNSSAMPGDELFEQGR